MPEFSSIEESAVRLEKLRALQKEGVDPYPSASRRTHAIGRVLASFDELEGSKEKVTVTGRVMAMRGHGGACFADIEDGSGKIQLHIKKDVIGAEAYALLEQTVDRGDFLQVEGVAFVTKRGERSLEASSWTMLAKAIRPLPDKWHGLADVEIRYRRRELDLVANPEVREIFRKRSALVAAIREFMAEDGFMEVETPILQPVPGGATARPFVTHHNALDIDLFLRVAPELYLKRLIAGGYERVFEIARCFRNEGIDHLHNPEFTQIEFYQAYADYKDLMKMTERLLTRVVEKTIGKLQVEHDGRAVDFAAPYPRITFRDAILEYGGPDIDLVRDRADLAKEAQKMNVEVAPSDGAGAIMDSLFKKLVRPKIINPTFVIDHPVELSPLAKRHHDNPRYAERFQLLLGAGTELINAFSELNDPLDQRERFAEQEKLRALGDEEAQRLDEDFLGALEIGLPPTAGFGMGIDRLSAILTGSHGIKEVILFPTLRPEQK